MTTLKGIFPNPKPPRKKNYVQENVRSLRQMEKYFHSNRESEKLPKLSMEKHQYNKYQNIASKVYSSLRGSSTISDSNNYINNNCGDVRGHRVNRKTSAPTSVKNSDIMNKQHNINRYSNNNTRHQPIPEINIKHTKKIKHKTDIQNTNRSLPDSLNLLNINQDFNSPHESSGKSKSTHRGSQTMDTTDIDAIYSEGVIRYSSTKDQRHNAVLGKSGKKIDLDDTTDCVDIKKNVELSGPKENINYVKANKEISVATKIATQLNNGVLPPSYRKGVIPKYIIERKEEQVQQRMEKAKFDATNADCPPGHFPLPDKERMDALHMLKKKYEDLVNELNKLPIRSDTLRSQRRKMDLEQQLKKLEDGIKTFSRPKVFIKRDE